MKIPTIFVPEKISDEKIKSLGFVKEKDIGSITEFVLNEWPYAKFAQSSKIHNLIYERLYSSVSKMDIIDNICISYSSSGDNFTPALDILKFQDAQTMKRNISNMTECARKLNVNDSLKVYIIVKGSYACFVYTSDYSQEEIVDIHKNKFGFREIRQ